MEGVGSFLLTQGVLGVVSLVLGVVNVKQFNKSERQQLRIEELQELRLQDSKDVTRDVTTVLEGNSQANRILAEKIEVAKLEGRR